jgi:hypothetical protein
MFDQDHARKHDPMIGDVKTKAAVQRTLEVCGHRETVE